MSAKKGFFFKLSVAAVVFLTLMVVISSVLISEESPFTPLVGVPHDWTHRHLVYSNPGTGADALAHGRFEQWYKTANDPRYQMQQIKRNPAMRALTAAPDFAARMSILGAFSAAANAAKANPKKPKEIVEKDWSMNLGAGSVGAGQYPAKYSFSTTTASCSDFVVYNTGATGVSGSQANIIAYNNIYSSCGTSPTVYWSYYTGGGTASTSVVLSLDGMKVAFMESGGGTATLRIVKWAASQGTDFSGPVAPSTLYTNTTAGAGGNTNWSSCSSGSCMISVAFQAHGSTDTTSAPWYDYASDTIYVGDSGGYLHEFTGVFNGAPGEVTTTWPVLVQSGVPLTGPVFDDSRSLIFVGSSAGYLQSVKSSSGAVLTSAAEANAGSFGITDAPLVDPAANVVYVFEDDCSADTKPCVLQFAENFGAGGLALGHQGMGTISTTIPMYAGTFDNAYYTNSTAGTGTMWVCGDTGGMPILYHVAVTATTLPSAAVAAATVSNATTPCSPVTEFCTNSGAACSSGTDTSGGQKDYVFVSPQTQTTTAIQSCTASEGCVLSYTITTAPAATYSGSGGFPGGASGMVVDTQSTGIAGTLNIYFGILSKTTGCTGNGSVGSGTGGCAIQAGLASP